MILILVFGAIAVGVLFMGEGVSTSSSTNRVVGGLTLPDIDPSEQGGSFKKTYDLFFLKYANKHGVPFALIKAHAVAESSLDPKAYNPEDSTLYAQSRGLMQLLWGVDETKWTYDRFSKYGYPGKLIGNGALLFDPEVNIDIATQLIKDNLRDFGSLRDAVNAYNTGKSESVFKAPNNYVNKVIGYYETIIKRKV